MNEEEAREFYAKLSPWTQKKEYVPVFSVPPDPWRIDASWEDAYYESAKEIIGGVVQGKYMPGIHGVAGVFLFRHYMELALKYIIINARWLKERHKNAEPEDVAEIGKTHNLTSLWNTAKQDCKGKIRDESWSSLDVGFVEAMIEEFHSIDQGGFRFRYHGDKFGVPEPVPEGKVVQYLDIKYKALLVEMQHTKDVLWAIREQLVYIHAENDEWRAEMESW